MRKKERPVTRSVCLSCYLKLDQLISCSCLPLSISALMFLRCSYLKRLLNVLACLRVYIYVCVCVCACICLCEFVFSLIIKNSIYRHLFCRISDMFIKTYVNFHIYIDLIEANCRDACPTWPWTTYGPVVSATMLQHCCRLLFFNVLWQSVSAGVPWLVRLLHLATVSWSLLCFAYPVR